jgi:hypothetical protein
MGAFAGKLGITFPRHALFRWILLFMIFLMIDVINNDKRIKCDKWIVITAFNPPSPFIIDLEKVVEDWKIVVIGNNETNDIQWDKFMSSNKLFYL